MNVLQNDPCPSTLLASLYFLYFSNLSNPSTLDKKAVLRIKGVVVKPNFLRL